MTKILVSIHDIHGGNFLQIEKFLGSFAASTDVKKIALMIVPSYKSLTPLKDQIDFCSWIGKKHKKGHEIFVHGLNHCTSKILIKNGFNLQKIRKRSFSGDFINKHLANNEAEFCGWKEEDKIEVAGKAKHQFEECGIKTAGFVAPAWYGNLKHESLQFLEIETSESRFYVLNVKKNIKRLCLPFNYLGNSGISNILDLFQPGLFRIIALFTPCFRLVIHPQDLIHSGKKNHLKKMINRGKLVHYKEFSG